MERVLDGVAGEFAVVGGPDTGQRQLLLVRISNGGADLLHPPIPIDNFTPQVASWFRLPEPSDPAFLYTLNYPSAGVVTTEILVPSDGEYRSAFADGMGTCEPARLEDIDQDGEPELVTYVDDPSNGNCISECHIDLQERFGLSIAWVEIREWNGTDWAVSLMPNRAFYARLGDRYSAAAEWASTSPRWTCGPKGAEFLRRWARRARDLAGGG
jgi:hypothetical protein